MNDLEKEKLKQFINDNQMSDAVYNYLISVCIKPREYSSIEMAGGYKLAVDIIQNAWLSMAGLKVDAKKNKGNRNIGI